MSVSRVLGPAQKLHDQIQWAPNPGRSWTEWVSKWRQILRLSSPQPECWSSSCIPTLSQVSHILSLWFAGLDCRGC